VAQSSAALSVIIVSYNTREMTLACLRSIFEQARDDSFEVIVVDNASADGSADSIERDFPQVRLVRSPHNIGFARANNVAAGMAGGEYLLLLNPDTVVLDHAIDHLMTFAAEHPGAGIWGGRTVFADGSLNPTSCWRFMSLWSLFTLATGLTALGRENDLLNREGYGGWQRDSVRQVDVVTGCLLLIRRNLWDRLEGFDESFFMYSEEIDLCYRAGQLGARPMLTPDATIIHYDGASKQVLSSKMINLYSGKVLFMRKHWPAPKLFAGLFLLKVLVLTRMLKAVAGASGGSSSGRVAAEGWRRLWSARSAWAKGYPALTRRAQ
jgi:N-acetylglucosaminyl-diphospho-decaprenol L-rhamnosyltransferase